MDIRFDCPIFTNEEIAFNFCINEGLIDNQMKCENDHNMILAKDHSKKFGLLWKCSSCKKKFSILNGSVFADSNLSLSKNLLLIYCWSMEISCKLTQFQCGVSDKSVTALFNLIRNACFQNVYQHDITKIGGEGLTIEIDETLMSRRKYHRGRILSEKWIFGGICRETGEIFAYLVPDRKGETLLFLVLNESFIAKNQIIHFCILVAYPHESDDIFLLFVNQ